MRFILAANINYVTFKLFSVAHVRDRILHADEKQKNASLRIIRC